MMLKKILGLVPSILTFANSNMDSTKILDSKDSNEEIVIHMNGINVDETTIVPFSEYKNSSSIISPEIIHKYINKLSWRSLKIITSKIPNFFIKS